MTHGARGGAVDFGTALKAGKTWVRIFIDIIFLAPLWHWG